MRHRRGEQVTWGVVLVALALVACTAPSADPTRSEPATPTTASTRPVDSASNCQEVAARGVDALQRYVDAFSGVDPEDLDAAVTRQQGTLDEISTAIRDRADALGCDELRPLLAAELERLSGVGPVAQDMAATFRSGLLDSPDPSDPGATVVTVGHAHELVAAVAGAGDGSRITLEAGEYVLERSLVAFRSMTISGPSDGTAVIASSAPGAAILMLADGNLQLSDVTVRHTGDDPASVVVVRTGGVQMDGVVVSGARTDGEGAGGFGLVLRPDDAARGDDSVVVDSVFRDNAGGGILAAATTAPDLRRVTVEGPGGCGVCFQEQASGQLVDSTVAGQAIGVRVEDEAAPTVRATISRENTVGIGTVGTGTATLRDNEAVGNETGIEIGGSGSPRLVGNELRDNTTTGLQLGDQATPTVEDLLVEGVTDMGVVVLGDAAPEFEGGTVSNDGEVGIVFTGRAGGSVAGLTVTGQRIGMQVEEQAGPHVTGLVFRGNDDAGVVLAGESTATLADLTCDPPDGVILLVDDADPELAESVSCEVVDGRG